MYMYIQTVHVCIVIHTIHIYILAHTDWWCYHKYMYSETSLLWTPLGQVLIKIFLISEYLCTLQLLWGSSNCPVYVYSGFLSDCPD